MKTIRQRVDEWRERHPERARAHNIVYAAVRNGTLKKTKCFCGNVKVEAHHEDYEEPLKVVWLCKRHHIEADKKRRSRLTNS